MRKKEGERMKDNNLCFNNSIPSRALKKRFGSCAKRSLIKRVVASQLFRRLDSVTVD